jgi:type I restriction enzyme R subunit
MNRPPFIAFDEHRAVRIYQRSLPHWRQDGVTYFVTFRLGDSIPAGVARQWDDERRRWLAARSTNKRNTDLSPWHTGARSTDLSPWHGTTDLSPCYGDIASALGRLSPTDLAQYHKHFNRQMQDYLDRGIGECHLRDRDCVSIVRSQLLSGDGDSYHVGDFVIMPNHVHLLIVPVATDLSPSHSRMELEQVLRGIKGASSRHCNLKLGRTGQFWQPESYDHIVRSLEQLLAYREYIAGNPQRAGLIVDPQALYRAGWMDDWLKQPQHGLQSVCVLGGGTD